MKKIINLYKKYENIVNYIIVGCFTTVVSLGTYYLCVLIFLNPDNGIELQIANIVSWIASVTFAYFANRKFVFKSNDKKILKEASKFYISRISTLLIDMLFMFMSVTIFSVNDKIAKILVQFIILVLNYVFSKLFVFKSKNSHNTKLKKVLFIASTGGHFSELMQLAPMFKNYDYYIITEKTKTNTNLNSKYPGKVNYLIFGSKDHLLTYIFKFGANCFKSLYLYFKIRPKVIITTGTHTAVPICYIGKIFGSKIIFIETFANSETKTLSGKLVYPIADLFLVQWEEMLELYPKAVYKGGIY